MKKGFIAIMLIAAAARADQFHFSAPLKLQHLMPEVHQVAIECKVYKTRPALFLQKTDRQVGEWVKFVNVSGSVNETVQGDITTLPDQNGEAKFYQCAMFLNDFQMPDPVGSPAVRPKPGTKVVWHQEGPIPAQ